MTIHVFTYLIYLAGLLYWFFSIVEQKQYSQKKFLVAEIVKTGTSTVSLLCMGYVFWTVYKISSVSYRQESVADINSDTVS